MLVEEGPAEVAYQEEAFEEQHSEAAVALAL